MGRAAVQRAVRLMEAEGKDLKAGLADLVSKGKITQELRNWADEVRIAGNDAAHPEEMGSVSETEARSSLEFLDDFVRLSLVVPAKRAARAAARTATAECRVNADVPSDLSASDRT
jgi:hypothetical protein